MSSPPRWQSHARAVASACPHARVPVRVLTFACVHVHRIGQVILSTNIAETSVTIDGVVYVVDCGLAKLRMHHPGKRIDSLLATPISKAAARQRQGRAGRQQPGKCFRLYTEDSFLGLTESSVPEIQRTSLAAAILSLKVWPPPANVATCHRRPLRRCCS